MTRTELFNYIKESNLQNEIKDKFGKPYNSVSTNLLQDFVDVIEAAKETITTPANSSNMSYKELKEFVKTNNLQEFVKSFYGKNYTNLSTEELRVIYDKANNTNESTAILKEGIDNIKEEFIDIKARKVLTSLCTSLNRKDLLKLLN